MKQVLQIQAGRQALAHIREHGLSPSDICTVFGASGAAKWLTICGLDQAVFGDWLSQSRQPVTVFGTSVGALKLAAAVQPDCRTRLKEFALRYAGQRLSGKPAIEAIGRETEAVIDAALGADGVEHLLQSSRYRYHCGAVHVTGRLAATNQRTQVFGMITLASSALRGRRRLLQKLTRVIFSPPSAKTGMTEEATESTNNQITSQERVDTLHIPLNEQNIRSALLASGAIPVYLNAVQLPEPANATAATGSSDHYHGRRTDGTLILRDGGLLDYHPLPDNLSNNRQGLVLYPHFYSKLTEGWFDKFYRWRKVPADRLENVILVSPTKEFVRSLPGGRIPDRRDFLKYQDQEDIRIQRWCEATKRSEELGTAWMEFAEKGDWKNVVTPLR